MQWIKYKASERLEQNLQSATNLVIGDTLHFNGEDSLQFDLFEEGNDSVSIKKELWGIFNVVEITSHDRNKRSHKNFFYGTELNDTLNACLFLVDHHRPLQISGSTRLTGNAYIPGANIKPGYIDGKGYDGKELVGGNILKSDTIFPSENKHMLAKLYDVFKITHNKDFQKANEKPLEDSIYNSFENDIQYYYINRLNPFISKSIKGKAVLFSDSVIHISRNTAIEDAIIIAPEIDVDDHFEGSAQLIASRIIKIGKHCTLNYPSAVILLKDSASKTQGTIDVGDSTTISGFLFANAFKKDQFKNIVTLQKGSVFEGIVYVHGFLQPAGDIHGTVITDYFLYRSVIATYENSLVDAVIDRTKLSPYFIGTTLVKMPGKLKVIKWLK
ncbi:MAG: hypothetical protein JST86_00195 [Bacteroidetes bacterium]|nr:hypothetical protein [Bacteroidota bacterium]